MLPNLALSPIGLGLAALGRPGYINLGHGEDLRGQTEVDAMERNAHEVLDAALDGGVRYFDAARSYGKAEAFLASWLDRRVLSPGEVTVGSKWGYTYTADWRVDAEVHEVKEHSAAVLERQWRKSSGHLGGYLKVYQIHSASFDSSVLDNQKVLDELARLKRAGIVIGLIELYAGATLPDGFKDTAPYIVLLIMLAVRPQGLFGTMARKKV